MSEVVNFHTHKDPWSLEHVLAESRDIIDECADQEEMKRVDAGLTIYELKLLVSKIEEQGE